MADFRVVHVPCVVVGSGIAGLSAALAHGNCLVVSKSNLGDGSSRWAQGGIAAAMGDDDEPGLHAVDTQKVSVGISDESIASMVAEAGPDRIRWLTELGARFDTGPDAALALGREAGHSRRRIVHANGDATGAEIMRTLVAATLDRPDIERLDDTFAIDLLRVGNRVGGVLVADACGELMAIAAPAVVLATGGIGQLYEKTTNPGEVSADGLAMAARAGAVIRDAEFVQFHPTALDAAVDPMPLLTEALRGEGAQLLDDGGERFMLDVHPDAELAPRDVVAREIWKRCQSGAVFLDARMVGSELPARFPTVWRIAQRAGLDPRSDLLPVSPAQHYHMGGVATDDAGRTSLRGLYAAGEVAATGLHGANRLASNSLLEGLVFGYRVARSIVVDAVAVVDNPTAGVPATALEIQHQRGPDIESDITSLRQMMWQHVGLVRHAAGLRQATITGDELAPSLSTDPEGRNLMTAARLVTTAAIDRQESRGSHYRSDHPAVGSHSSSSLLQPTRHRSTTISLQQKSTRVPA